MQISKKIILVFFLVFLSNYLFLNNLKANSYFQIDINKDHKELITFNDQILNKKSLEFMLFKYFNQPFENKIFYLFSESDGLHQYKKRLNMEKIRNKEIYLYTETESKGVNLQTENQFINFTNIDRNLFLLDKIPFINKYYYLNIFSFTNSTNYKYTIANDPCNLILIDKENAQIRYYIDKKIYSKFKCIYEIVDSNYIPKNEKKNDLLKFDKNFILIIDIVTFILNLFLVRFFYTKVDYYGHNYSVFYLGIAVIMIFLVLFYNTLLTLTNYLILIYLLLLNYLKLSKKIKIIISIVIFYLYLLFVFNYDYLYYFGFEFLGNIFILVIIHRLIFFGKPK